MWVGKERRRKNQAVVVEVADGNGSGDRKAARSTQLRKKLCASPILFHHVLSPLSFRATALKLTRHNKRSHTRSRIPVLRQIILASTVAQFSSLSTNIVR